MEIILLLLGIIIGSVFSFIFRCNKLIGALRIDNSDPDGPYLFLEIRESINELSKHKHVLLEVKQEDFISHK